MGRANAMDDTLATFTAALRAAADAIAAAASSTPVQTSQWITVDADGASALGLELRALRRIAREVGARRVGRRLLVGRGDVEAWIARQPVTRARPALRVVSDDFADAMTPRRQRRAGGAS